MCSGCYDFRQVVCSTAATTDAVIGGINHDGPLSGLDRIGLPYKCVLVGSNGDVLSNHTEL